MDLSRKIILASCVAAAFLAIGIGCTVEDRNLEEKEVFVCLKDSDCLEGSKCVITTEEGGRCIREDQISHCLDLDGDGFLKESEDKYLNECGLGDLRDPDDNDKLVYPGANEICDGKDNSNDGCIDGNCPEGKDCRADDSECEPLIQFCNIPGNFSFIETYAKSVCAADKLGVNWCSGGELVFALYKGGKEFVPQEGKSCPSSLEKTDGYKAKDDDCDGFDNNCNGMVDEECSKCDVKPDQKFCHVTSQGTKFFASEDSDQYQEVKKVCGEGSCACIGTPKCASENDPLPSCMNSSGSKIEAEAISNEECYKTFDVKDNN